MTTIILNYNEICERIYAATALATLNKECRTALLHPDHAASLKLMVRDSIASIIASLEPGIVDSVSYGDDSVCITIGNDSVDLQTAKQAISGAAATLSLSQVKIAASSEPGAIINLASAMPTICTGIVRILSTSARPGRIIPA